MDERIKNVLSDDFIGELYKRNYDGFTLREVLYHVLFQSKETVLSALDETFERRMYSQSITECVYEIIIDILMSEISIRFQNIKAKKILNQFKEV